MQENFEKINSTDHDAIYHAALEGKIDKIHALLKEGAVIDELDGSLLSPAGRLAKEGNIEAAELLRKWFGANVNAILHGATRGDQKDYIDYLRLIHGASYISWVNTDLYEATKKLDMIMEQFYQAAKDANYNAIQENQDSRDLFEQVKSRYIYDVALYEEVYHAAKELNDASKLQSIMYFQTYKSFLIDELKKYVNNPSSGHPKRAKSLIEACSKPTDKSELRDLLDEQKTIISGNPSTLFNKAKHEELPKKPIQGKYEEIIERHRARL